MGTLACSPTYTIHIYYSLLYTIQYLITSVLTNQLYSHRTINQSSNQIPPSNHQMDRFCGYITEKKSQEKRPYQLRVVTTARTAVWRYRFVNPFRYSNQSVDKCLLWDDGHRVKKKIAGKMDTMARWSDMSSIEKAFYDYHRGARPELARNPALRQMMQTREQKVARYGPRIAHPEYCWACGKSQHVIEASTPAGPRWRCKRCGMWIF